MVFLTTAVINCVVSSGFERRSEIVCERSCSWHHNPPYPGQILVEDEGGGMKDMKLMRVVVNWFVPWWWRNRLIWTFGTFFVYQRRKDQDSILGHWARLEDERRPLQTLQIHQGEFAPSPENHLSQPSPRCRQSCNITGYYSDPSTVCAIPWCWGRTAAGIGTNSTDCSFYAFTLLICEGLRALWWMLSFVTGGGSLGWEWGTGSSWKTFLYKVTFIYSFSIVHINRCVLSL